MGDDLAKLKASIKSISRIIGKKTVEKIPEPEKSPATAKPVTKQKP